MSIDTCPEAWNGNGTSGSPPGANDGHLGNRYGSKNHGIMGPNGSKWLQMLEMAGIFPRNHWRSPLKPAVRSVPQCHYSPKKKTIVLRRRFRPRKHPRMHPPCSQARQQLRFGESKAARRRKKARSNPDESDVKYLTAHQAW